MDKAMKNLGYKIDRMIPSDIVILFINQISNMFPDENFTDVIKRYILNKTIDDLLRDIVLFLTDNTLRYSTTWPILFPESKKIYMEIYKHTDNSKLAREFANWCRNYDKMKEGQTSYG